MPKDPATLPQHAIDDDDEIVDLLEVVKPGKDLSGSAASVPEQSEAADFSADLDAMLDELSRDGDAPASSSDAQPFPDPTPVNHTVDANEELSLPSMDDLDNLLESLGVDKTAEAPAGAEPVEPVGSDINAMDAMPMGDAADAPEALEECFDEPAQEAPEPAPAAEKEAPAAVPVDLEDLPFLAGQGPEEAEAKPVQEAADDLVTEMIAEQDLFEETPAEVAVPATISEDLFDEAVQAASKSAEPAPEASVATAARGEVDLNELDALLDDMLASAPASGAMPADTPKPEAPSGAETPAQAADTDSRLAGLEETVSILNSTMTTELRAGLAEARADIARLHVAVQHQEERSPSAGEVPEDVRAELDSLHSGLAEARLAGEQLPAMRSDLETLRENLRDIDTHVASLENSPAEQLSASLAEKDSVIAELRAAMEGQAEQMTALKEEMAGMREGLDKIAAEAAAKIIREEIAFLLQHSK